MEEINELKAENERLKKELADMIEANMFEESRFYRTEKLAALKGELAEKEKELEFWKKATENRDLTIEKYVAVIKNINQYKIEFAIAELEKAKEFIVRNLYAKATYGGVEHCVTGYIATKLDQQIKELKKN